jgi:Pyridoxamine 5'-phosphate oxidase
MRDLGPALPPELLSALSQADLPSRLGRALPLITIDPEGRPHPMLCSYLELLAVDAGTIRVVIGAGSGSARNLEARRAATLLLVEPERTVYVKCRAAGAPVTEGVLARFTLRVETVLEDTAAEWEGGVRITGGITYAPAPALDTPEAQATRRLLRAGVPGTG